LIRDGGRGPKSRLFPKKRESSFASGEEKSRGTYMPIKARRWITQFGTRSVVPAAVLSGVSNPANLSDAQDAGLSLFWAHRLDGLAEFIKASGQQR
jgi:hypothetical protein